MALRQRFGGGLVVLAAAIVGAAAQVPSSRASDADPAGSRISGDWRSSSAALIAARPRLPQDAADLGAAPSDARLERVLLLLQPSPEQGRALDAELANQQNPKSPEYHHWLTPSEFAGRYANSASDVAAIVLWLESEGFAVAPLPAGRGWIEFSATVAQLEQAFHTQVHAISTPSGIRFGLADSLAVPAAFQPLIHGLVSLDGVVAEPAITIPQAVSSPIADLRSATSPVRAEALTPSQMAQLLHLDALHASGGTGAGEAIAIAARSNVQPQDVAAFRASFGLLANPVQVVLNGVDPGRTADEAAALMMASWAGAAAPEARIVLVSAATTGATDGLDLSLAAIVDQQPARTAAVGFSACESALSEAHQAFYAALYRQAAAQGMAIIAAIGDRGAAACHSSAGDGAITSGFGVNALASTPWNTAVGTAALIDAGTGDTMMSGWSPRNPADPAYAGGGGRSALYSVPQWQPLPAHDVSAVPGRYARLTPDLALPSAFDSGINRGMVFCMADSTGTACNAMRAGGSAPAAALFAGVAALIAEKNGPQGNLAPRLYQLSRRSGIFQDVQQGNTRLPCISGSPGCGASGQIGFEAAAGYDLATGLGSIDALKLVNEWANPAATGTDAVTVALSVAPTVPNMTYNPTAQITLTATVASGTGGATPTGTVFFGDALTSADLNPSGTTLDANGVATFTLTSGLGNGGNNITAIYSGDSTYASAVSPTLTITSEPSTTALTVVPSTATPAAGISFPVTVNIAAGSPPAGTVAPTGKVTLNIDGKPAATASLATTGSITAASFPSVTINATGSHSLQAVYAGDTNYVASTSQPVTVTIGKGATVTTLTATPATLTAGAAESFTATIAPANAAAGSTYTITGTVSFYDGAKLLDTVTVNANSATLSNISLASGAVHTITAVYSGDSSWSASTSNAIILQSALLPDSVTLTVSTSNTGPGQVVSLVATVTPASPPAANIELNPTGNVIFYNGTTVVGTMALSASLNSSSTATLVTGNLPAGADTLTAYYVGDLFYAAGTSNSVTVNVQDFSITPASSNAPSDLDIIKGSSGQASFIVSGLGGFAGQVQVVCTVPTQDDMSCSPSPVQVTPTATITFSVQTFAAGGVTTSSHHSSPFWPRALGGTALAALMFFVLPFGRRARVFTGRVRGVLVIGLLLIGLGGAGIGCSNSVTAPVNNGTPLGVTTLTITAAANVDNTVISHSAYLTVNVLPPGSTGTAVPAKGRRRK